MTEWIDRDEETWSAFELPVADALLLRCSLYSSSNILQRYQARRKLMTWQRCDRQNRACLQHMSSLVVYSIDVAKCAEGERPTPSSHCASECEASRKRARGSGKVSASSIASGPWIQRDQERDDGPPLSAEADQACHCCSTTVSFPRHNAGVCCPERDWEAGGGPEGYNSLRVAKSVRFPRLG